MLHENADFFGDSQALEPAKNRVGVKARNMRRPRGDLDLQIQRSFIVWEPVSCNMQASGLVGRNNSGSGSFLKSRD